MVAKIESNPEWCLCVNNVLCASRRTHLIWFNAEDVGNVGDSSIADFFFCLSLDAFRGAIDSHFDIVELWNSASRTLDFFFTSLAGNSAPELRGSGT